MTISVREENGEPSRWEKMLKSLHLRPKRGAWGIPGSPYIALFRPLQDVQSRFILVAGILLPLQLEFPFPSLESFSLELSMHSHRQRRRFRAVSLNLWALVSGHTSSLQEDLTIESRSVPCGNLRMGVLLGNYRSTGLETSANSNGRQSFGT